MTATTTTTRSTDQNQIGDKDAIAAASATASSSPSTTSASSSTSTRPRFQGTIVVCTGPTCTKKGGGMKLVELLQDQIRNGSSDDDNNNDNNIQIETVNCVSECAECGLGPNCELRAQGDDGPFYPIRNKVQSAQQVQDILGISS
ncbi:hypothetical protein ACA910_014813 [Epithemia clementina (nom. ined.)]